MLPIFSSNPAYMQHVSEESSQESITHPTFLKLSMQQPIKVHVERKLRKCMKPVSMSYSPEIDLQIGRHQEIYKNHCDCHEKYL